MNCAIELKGVTALIDGFPALAEIDFNAATSEIVRLSGRNGSGKTTLLRACAGLMPLIGTSARVLGFDLLAPGSAGAQERRNLRQHVGLVSHTDALYDDLTVSDQLSYNARLVRAEHSEIAAAAERVGLEERLWSVKVGRLSAGQRKRLALAVLALVRPQLWLLDEPHAGLDESGRGMLNGLLADAANAGATVVFAAHEGSAESSAHRSAGGVAAASQPIRNVLLAGGRQAAPSQSASKQPPPGQPNSNQENS